jgi:succinate dehydrogenase flavin-adding protein (antitoxin of CptAB toxin-antitoxin module)
MNKSYYLLEFNGVTIDKLHSKAQALYMHYLEKEDKQLTEWWKQRLFDLQIEEINMAGRYATGVHEI